MRSSTRIPQGKLFAHRGDDFSIARTQDWITQISASLSEIFYRVGARRRRTTKAFDLGKYTRSNDHVCRQPEFPRGLVGNPPSRWLELREIVPETFVTKYQMSAAFA